MYKKHLVLHNSAEHKIRTDKMKYLLFVYINSVE
jgi:hypothetical protein